MCEQFFENDDFVESGQEIKKPTLKTFYEEKGYVLDEIEYKKELSSQCGIK